MKVRVLWKRRKKSKTFMNDVGKSFCGDNSFTATHERNTPGTSADWFADDTRMLWDKTRDCGDRNAEIPRSLEESRESEKSVVAERRVGGDSRDPRIAARGLQRLDKPGDGSGYQSKTAGQSSAVSSPKTELCGNEIIEEERHSLTSPLDSDGKPKFPAQMTGSNHADRSNSRTEKLNNSVEDERFECHEPDRKLQKQNLSDRGSVQNDPADYDTENSTLTREGANERKRPRSESARSGNDDGMVVEGSEIRTEATHKDFGDSTDDHKFQQISENKVSTGETATFGENKRARQACYRCGGLNHIVSLCPSERNAIENLDAIICEGCDGRGHTKSVCPTVIGEGNPCYVCRLPGYFARDCPNDARQDFNYEGYSGGSSTYRRRQRHAFGSSNRPHGYNDRGISEYDYRHGDRARGEEDYSMAGFYGTNRMYGGDSKALYDDRFSSGRNAGRTGGGFAWGSGFPGTGRYTDFGRYDPRDAPGGVADREAGHGHGYREGMPGRPTGGYGSRYYAQYRANTTRHNEWSVGHGGYGDVSVYQSRGGFSRYGEVDVSSDFRQGRSMPPFFASGRCFRCKGEGHRTKDCPQRPADADPNGCYKCGRLGHRSRECSACYNCFQEGHRAVDCPQQ